MAIDHPDDALPPGYQLGPYQILRVLGHGGFGITYQARRSAISGDMVAIKELFPRTTALRSANLHVLPQPGANQAEVNSSIEMFIREAQLICALAHPNIVQGIEAFRANGTAYLVMRYVTGRNLKESLRDPTGFRANSKSIPALLAPLLDALQTLHQNGLLHTDIKPDNIFLGVGYEPILIDLGSARCHAPGMLVEEASTYSHYFSAIEQLDERFGPIGPWTDIYQLSAVLYRCISGGKLPDSCDRLIAASDPYLPLAQLPESRAYPAALIQSIDQGLRLKPKDRPQSIAQWRSKMALSSNSKSPVGTGASSQGTNNDSPVTEHSKPNRKTGQNQPPPPNPTAAESSGPLVFVAAVLLLAILILIFVIIF